MPYFKGITKNNREPIAQPQTNCVTSNLAKQLWLLFSTVVIVHLLWTLGVSSLYVVSNVQIERLDSAKDSFNDFAGKIYTVILTLATPATIYSSAKKSSKDKEAEQF